MVYHNYGPPEVLHMAEVAKPTPKDDEVLIKIHAVALNAADAHLLTADIFLVRFMGMGVFKPKNAVLGADVAGVIEAVGRSVTTLKPGDAVFGDLASYGWGGLAEYTCAPATALAPLPTNLTFEEAAAVPLAGMTALQALRKGDCQPGQQVLINGASGGVGTFLVQIAKALGAEVTAVCSTRNVDQARALGADHVIDYTKADFSRSGQQYDLILAANGNRRLADYRRALRPNGKYVMVGGTWAQMRQALTQGWLVGLTSQQKVLSFTAKANQQDLHALKELIEAGKLKPVIDRCYPLAETAAAMRYLLEGHARGKVVISVNGAAA